MTALTGKIGPYLHAEGCAADKVFDLGGGGKRTFKVVIAGALHAGIIGPEYNGIAVLDDDANQVVLDQHCRIDSGYFGPSAKQKAEFDRIMAMDWKGFTAFVKSHPRYRTESVPDVNQPVPMLGRRDEDRTIFPASEKSADCPYEFPLETRHAIEDFVCGHAVHRERHGKGHFAWNVKVHGLDTSGHHPDFKNDPAFDARWNELVGKDDEMFWEACSDGLRLWLDGEYTTWPGDDQGDYKFHVEGRSGGWLCLDEIKGVGRLAFDGMADLKACVRELDDEELVKIYRTLVSLDHDVRDPAKEVAYQLAFRRQQLEEEWRDEATPKAG